MKKFLTFILVLAMVLSVSSFAMATGISCPDPCTDATHVAAVVSGGTLSGHNVTGGTTLHYTSLQEAVTDAEGKEDSYVVLLTTEAQNCNVTVTKSVNINWGGNSYANSRALSLRGVTFTGSGSAASITFSGYGSANHITDVTLKNITIKDETVGDNEGSWEHGYLEFTNLTAEGVTFCDIQLNGTCSLKKCTFNNTKPSWYAAWVNSGSATFEECDFTGTRGAKIHEQYGSEVESVTFDKCQFDLSEKPGVVIGTLNDNTAVTIQNSHFRSCQPGEQSKYAYETDTDVKSFNFTLGEDNHICEGENKTTDWQTVKEPTATEDGLKVKLCLNNIIDIFNPSTTPGTTTSELCHYIVEEEIIPALGSGSGSTDSSKGNGIKVEYEGGNSFSTSKSAVPTSVEIDGVPVTFNGTGSNFSVGCISSDAKWVTVRWNSTSVTTNFTPDGLVECTTVSIPKTGDMSIWAAIAQFLGF